VRVGSGTESVLCGFGVVRTEGGIVELPASGFQHQTASSFQLPASSDFLRF
jgi:hypothetical protein